MKFADLLSYYCNLASIQAKLEADAEEYGVSRLGQELSMASHWVRKAKHKITQILDDEYPEWQPLLEEIK